MRRVFAVIGFSFLFSTIFAVIMPNSAVIYALIAAVLALIAALIVRTTRKIHSLIAVLAAVVTAFGVFLVHNEIEVKPLQKYVGRECDIVAVCTDYGIDTSNTDRYILSVRKVDGENVRKFKLKLYTREPLTTEPGDVIELPVKMSDKYVNETSDYGEGTYLSAYLGNVEKMRVIGKSISVGAAFAKLRNYFCEQLNENTDYNSAALYKGFLFSDKSDLDESITSSFSRCGLQHTMAVSGLHINIITGLIFTLLSLIVKSRRKLSIVSIAAVILLMLTVGFRYSAVRAGIMMIIMLCGGLFYRRADSLNSMGFAALVLILQNPYCAVNISFLMSLCATFGMIVVFAPVSKFIFARANGKIKRVLCKLFVPFLQSLCAVITTLPLCILFFGTVSVIAPLCNMIILPIISAAIVFGVLFCILSPIPVISAFFAFILRIFAKIIISLTSYMSKIPFCTVGCRSWIFILWIALSLVLIATAYLLISLKFMKKRRVICAVSVLCALSLAVCSGISYADMANTVSVSVLRSGAGCCTVVNYMGDITVIGAGGSSSLKAVKTYFNANTVNEVFAVILPDGKNRYSQNAANVVQWLQPKNVFMDTDDDRRFAISSVCKSTQINSVSGLVLNGGRNSGYEIKTYTQEKSTALFMKARRVKILFCDKDTDFENLPTDAVNSDIYIVNGNKMPDFDGSPHTIIFCGSKQIEADENLKDKICIATADNNCLTIDVRQMNYKIENR